MPGKITLANIRSQLKNVPIQINGKTSIIISKIKKPQPYSSRGTGKIFPRVTNYQPKQIFWRNRRKVPERKTIPARTRQGNINSVTRPQSYAAQHSRKNLTYLTL